MILSSLLFLLVVLCGIALIALILLGEGARDANEDLPPALERAAHGLALTFVMGAGLLTFVGSSKSSPLLERHGLGLALDGWPEQGVEARPAGPLPAEFQLARPLDSPQLPPGTEGGTIEEPVQLAETLAGSQPENAPGGSFERPGGAVGNLGGAVGNPGGAVGNQGRARDEVAGGAEADRWRADQAGPGEALSTVVR